MKNYTEESIEDVVCKFFDNLDRKTSFFVGAGISVPSGLPDFRRLNKRALKAITKNSLTEEDYTFLSENLRPEVAFKIMVEEIGKEVILCLEDFEGYKPNSNHFFLAEALGRGHSIFTVNGDNLIEDACSLRGINLEDKVLFSSEQYLRFNEDVIKNLSDPLDLPGGYLFKLHGTIERSKADIDKYSSFLFTVNRIRKEFDKNKKEVLEYFLKNCNFVFMGYSALDDFDIYPIFLNVESNKSIFWFKFTPGLISELVSGKERLKVNETQSPEENHVNNMLRKKSKFLKLLGNSSSFVSNRLIPRIDPASCVYCSQLKSGEDECPNKLFGMDIPDIRLFFALGRLWEECWYEDSGTKAIEWFKKAEYVAEDMSLDKAYAKMSIGRVYDTQHGARNKDIVLLKYSEAFEIFKTKNAIADACKAKIELENFKRRELGDISGARKELEDNNFIENYIDKIKDSTQENDISIYAKYLNILALVYMGTKNEKLVSQCEELFKKSIELKQKIGDIAEEAVSYNSWGLFLRDSPSEDDSNLNKGIEILTKSLDIQSALGNFRAVAQNHRNLGLCYDKKNAFVSDKDKEERYFKLAEAHFKEGITSWNLATKNPPMKEIFEFNFRLGELYTKNEKYDMAISKLTDLKNKRIKLSPNDWHNIVRTRYLLLKNYYATRDCELAKREAKIICETYKLDTNQISDMRKTPIKIENAKMIFEDINKLFNHDEELNNESRRLLNELNRIFKKEEDK